MGKQTEPTTRTKCEAAYQQVVSPSAPLAAYQWTIAPAALDAIVRLSGVYVRYGETTEYTLEGISLVVDPAMPGRMVELADTAHTVSSAFEV